MVNDLTTITGSLQELIDTLEANLQEMGVEDAVFDSSTGLIGLANQILNIEQGTGNSIVEFKNLGTEFNYTRHDGGININFPQTITSIGANSFYYCYDLKELVIPNTISTIGTYCFYYCANLETITLPTNPAFTTLPSYCFGFCSKLNEINLPNNVTVIGSNCFYSCKELKHIELPDNLTTLNSNAFTNCSGLESINIPSTVTHVGNSCFSNTTGLEFYHLNWDETDSIIAYNSSNMPLNEDTLIIIPDDMTSDYVDKEYPIEVLIENSEVQVIMKNVSDSQYCRDGTYTLKLKLYYYENKQPGKTITLTGNNNSYSAVTDDEGIATFNLTNISSDTIYSASNNGKTINFTVKYKPWIFIDNCDSDAKLSNYGSPINIYNATITGTASLTYNSTYEAYNISNSASSNYLIFPIPLLDGLDNIVISCEVKIVSTSSSTPSVGFGIMPDESSLTSTFADVFYKTYSSATNSTFYVQRRRRSSYASVYSSSKAHKVSDWAKLTLVIKGSDVDFSWDYGDDVYSGSTTISSPLIERHYGIYCRYSTNAYIRNITVGGL